MKRVVGVAATISALAFLFSSRDVDAAPPPPCPPRAIVLDLELLEAFVDGGAATQVEYRHFSNDAGFEFEVEAGLIVPIAGAVVEGCTQPSKKLTISLVDPFTGAFHELEMEVAP